MKKGLKILGVLVVLVVIVIVFKEQVLLGLMNIVDFIGYKLNINVVSLIDFLNELYYI